MAAARTHRELAPPKDHTDIVGILKTTAVLLTYFDPLSTESATGTTPAWSMARIHQWFQCFGAIALCPTKAADCSRPAEILDFWGKRGPAGVGWRILPPPLPIRCMFFGCVSGRFQAIGKPAYWGDQSLMGWATAVPLTPPYFGGLLD